MNHNLLQFFSYSHLPEKMQAISKMFYDTAIKIDRNINNGPEKTTALRKLLEAKDCAVRATIWKSDADLQDDLRETGDKSEQ
ncbi:MAG: hypothetical protein IMF01_09435 [Proteobacteria bacterium]|nr:hypothetical protein [Pseudomonadota bacterium]